MEQLLETAQDRRMHGLKKVESGYDLTDVRQVETILDETYEFSELEMKELWQLRLLSDVFWSGGRWEKELARGMRTLATKW